MADSPYGRKPVSAQPVSPSPAPSPAASPPPRPEPVMRRWPHPVRQAVGEEDPMQHYIRCSLSYQNQMLADIKALLERIALNTDAAEQKKG